MSPLAMALLAGGVLVVAAVSIGAYFASSRSENSGSAEPLALAAVGDQSVVEGKQLAVAVRAASAGGQSGGAKYTYRLLEAPQGATVMADGRVLWTPSEAQGPGEYRVRVAVSRTLPSGEQQTAESAFLVRVAEDNAAPGISPLPSLTAVVGEAVSLLVSAHDPDSPAAELRYELVSGPDGAQVDAESGRFTWTATGAPRHETVVVAVRENTAGGLSATASFEMDVIERPSHGDVAGGGLTGRPLAGADTPPATVAANSDPLVPLNPVEPQPAQDADREVRQAEDDRILELYRQKQLTNASKQYEALRGILAARFERSHRAEIDAALGDDLKAWLEEHREIKEEFYTAIDPDHDDVPAALALFAAMWHEHPDQIEEHWNAAVAVAVTWDGRRGIEDYVRHQVRCKAILPGEMADAQQNFAYLIGTDSGRYLPWEFLVYVVNHRTPVTERQWAVANYLPQRLMIGKCYGDVKYDMTMLETNSEVCRLNGQDYTLPNILKFGGVCAMQADFASRVGKSLGIPAAYVRGEANSGDMHAWVEWVVLKQVGPQKINFSLESHGRYQDDKYYVGSLYHPQTGEPTTDRRMELELHTVGLDARAARHAKRVMQVWPTVREKAATAPREQFVFLSGVTRLCPGNTDAWRGMAEVTSGGELDSKARKLSREALDDLFGTFANYPDFTWTIFDDMISFEPALKKRIGYYQRLVLLYVTAQRPDLAAQARLKLTDMLLEDGQQDAAGNGLVQTLLAFADDGRYVPPMLDKLEQLCANYDGGAAIMDAFWGPFLRVVPQMRGDRPTQHAISMHNRAIAWFESRGNQAAVQQLRLELAKIAAGKGRRS